MHSTTLVLIYIAVTFVFAWTLAFSKGFEYGKLKILEMLTREELFKVAKRLEVDLGDVDES